MNLLVLHRCPLSYLARHPCTRQVVRPVGFPGFFAVWCLAARKGLDFFESTLDNLRANVCILGLGLSKPWLLQYPLSKLVCALQVIESLNVTE